MRGLIFLCALVFGCAVDAGEKPDKSTDSLDRVCTVRDASSRVGSLVKVGPTCCIGADTCHLTDSAGEVFLTMYSTGTPAQFENGFRHEWISSPSDLGLNRFAPCACLTLRANAPYNPYPDSTARCYVVKDQDRAILGGTAATQGRSQCYRPGAGQRAWLVEGPSASSACKADLVNLPAEECAGLP